MLLFVVVNVAGGASSFLKSATRILVGIYSHPLNVSGDRRDFQIIYDNSGLESSVKTLNTKKCFMFSNAVHYKGIHTC